MPIRDNFSEKIVCKSLALHHFLTDFSEKISVLDSGIHYEQVIMENLFHDSIIIIM